MTEQSTLEAGGSLKEGGITLSVSKDALSATVCIRHKFADRWNVERLLQFLDRHGITHGILPTAVHAIFRDNRFDESVVIAEGTPIIEGKPRKIKHLYVYQDIYKSLLKCRDPSRFVHEFVRALTITRDNPIAREIPGTDGEDGRDVLGKPIPWKSPCQEELFPGAGTMLSQDERELLAERDGVVSYDGDVYRVVGVKLHNGDVVPNGNDFVAEGTAAILGTVRSDTVIRAKGDVIVGESVEAASIFCDGCVVIGGTMEGGKRGRIEARGCVLARSVHYSEIQAGQTIFLAGAAVQSDLAAGQSIHLFGGNGRILGGTTRAEHEIWADEIGSKNEVGTILIVGEELNRLNEYLAELKADLNDKDGQLRKARSLSLTLKELKANQGSLPPDKEMMLMTAVRTEWGMRGQAELIRRQVVELESNIRGLIRTGHAVRCVGTVWPGTEIQMGRFIYRVDEPVSTSEFVLQDDHIEIQPLDEERQGPRLLERIHHDDLE